MTAPPQPLEAAGTITLKAAANLPARLFGGNAQQVQVTGLDYTLHLDLSKLPTSDITLPATNNWTVVWDATTDTYKRVEFTDLPAPASTLPGPPGSSGTPGGPSTVITGNGIVFSARNVIPVSIIDPSVLSIQTHGFTEPGDGGQGLYDRMLSAPATPANPAYVQSLDGTWWQLVSQGGAIYIEQFGGKGDSDGAGGGTDNVQPLYNAIDFIAWNIIGQKVSHNIKFGAKAYRFSGPMYFYIQTAIEGVLGGYNSQNPRTIFDFPPNVSCFTFHGNNTGPVGALPGGGGVGDGGVGAHGGSHGSSLRDIAFRQPRTGAWLTGGDVTKNVIFARTTIHLENIAIWSAPGNGVHYKAYAGYGGDLEGNANQWTVRNLYVHSCRGDAWWVEGADVNGGNMNGFNTHTEVGGCGIRSSSYFTNTYNGMQITGYGNNGVHYAGKLYVLIGGNGSATTPGTDNHTWYFVANGGPSAVYPEWSALNTHVLKLPIWDSGGGSYYYNPYIEVGGAAILHVPQPSHVFGGTLGGTSYSSTSVSSPFGFILGKVGGYAGFTEGTLEYARNGASTWCIVGGPNETYGFGDSNAGGLQFLSWRREADGPTTCEFGYRGNDIRMGYINNPPYLELTTQATTQGFSRQGPDPFRLALYDHAIRNPFDPTVAIVVGARLLPPADVGLYGRGDRFYKRDVSPGDFEGWICTTGGAITNGLWVNGGTYTNGDLRTNSAGRHYRNKTFGTGTVEPVHTSGTVTGADGLTWTYSGSGAPVFKTFGSIAA